MEEPTVQPMEPQAEAEAVDVEKKSHVMINDETPDGSLKEAPPMTIKRFIVLFALSNLYVSAGTAAIFLGAGICTLLNHGSLTLTLPAYTVDDIGGTSSEAWLGVANYLAVAAISPLVGSISDLIGRRYAALLGPIILAVGLIVVGTAHRIDVAIGGSAVAGVGAGLAETVGVAGLLELAPAKSRGTYAGISILVDLPFGAALTYGKISSPTVLVNYKPNCILEILGDGPHGSRSCILVLILSCSSFFITHLHGQILSGFPGEKLSLALTTLEFSSQSPESRSSCLACNGEVTTSNSRCDPEF